MIPEKAKEFVMAVRLKSGESVISLVSIMNPQCFMLLYPYEFSKGRINDEYFAGTINRLFPIAVDDIMFTKTMKPHVVSEYLALVQLDNEQSEIEKLVATMLSYTEDDSHTEERVLH